MSDLGDEIDSFLMESVSMTPSWTRVGTLVQGGTTESPVVFAGLREDDLAILRWAAVHLPSGVKVCAVRVSLVGQTFVAVQMHVARPDDELTDETLRIEILYPLDDLQPDAEIWVEAERASETITVLHVTDDHFVPSDGILNEDDDIDILGLAEQLDPTAVLDASRGSDRP